MEKKREMKQDAIVVLILPCAIICLIFGGFYVFIEVNSSSQQGFSTIQTTTAPKPQVKEERVNCKSNISCQVRKKFIQSLLIC